MKSKESEVVDDVLTDVTDDVDETGDKVAEAREVYKVWHQTPAQNLTARLEVYTTYIGSRYGLSI